jgi:predicted pyridoxine 5'-phosphate oxidase superfamily flavin-nucleotide-binding protein
MMAAIEGDLRAVIEASEWVAIATTGADGPHLAGTWGDYVRDMGFDNDQVIIPAGGYHKTEENLKKNPRVEVLVASRQIQRPNGSGQGCVLSGTGELQTSGKIVDAVKAKYPWARGALVIKVEDAKAQLS